MPPPAAKRNDGNALALRSFGMGPLAGCLVFLRAETFEDSI